MMNVFFLVHVNEIVNEIDDDYNDVEEMMSFDDDGVHQNYLLPYPRDEGQHQSANKIMNCDAFEKDFYLFILFKPDATFDE